MRHEKGFWERVDSIVLRRQGALLVIDVDPGQGYKEVRENIVKLIMRVRKKIPIYVFEMQVGFFGAPTDDKILTAIGKIKPIKKPKESAFEGTTLLKILRANNIRELVVAGFFHDSCIRSTMQAAERADLFSDSCRKVVAGSTSGPGWVKDSNFIHMWEDF